MKARTTLNCYSCGAAVSSDAPNCQHCGARLASVACPACFGMMFQNAKFCPHCGSPATQWESAGVDARCPACDVPMLAGDLRGIRLHECGKCYGLWLDTATFERICRDAEQQAAVLGNAQALGGVALGPVRYLRCPRCREHMHRVNFAQCSGVVVDVCRAHGTWFDRDELHRIVAFIRAGGLDRARAKEKTRIEEERRRLQAARRGTEAESTHRVSVTNDADLLSLVLGAAHDVFVHWLDH